MQLEETEVGPYSSSKELENGVRVWQRLGRNADAAVSTVMAAAPDNTGPIPNRDF
ncbi:hypothetical protein PAXRUDRAFT_828620 [Paxillus rubicundulus Ve08.2h10]|uniref:Uncharacterized protein n=1 Tax=Paxillus rubicundulus Ve08.2h10 TaxID=930991 RepID=A0A0D0DPA7_9AGAM|nr:hypothetical protein PAXRUDRAFT_828620 [Paxillus rubicundulus Ve08.2h10]